MNNSNPLASLYSSDFDEVTIKLASPEKILDWSHGEVTKPETINYRTQRSEKEGLFDQRIFGPEKDYECYCGKYKGIRYKGIVCEKCGVEITRSIVRRERMGHIELSATVSHVWFLRGVPSRMALVLGAKASDLEKVIYFAGYIITNVNEEERMTILKDLDSEYKSKIKTLQDPKSKEAFKELYLNTKKEIESIQEGVIVEDVDYNKYAMKYGSMFDAEIGAEAIYNIFKKIDLEKLQADIEEQMEKTRSQGTLKTLKKRLGVISGMIKAGVRPEWMFLTRLPVLPPALRPMVALEGGRHATSDVNDLYRRVINRNNRLKKLKDINAPHVILRNEMRILQEAVDALIDNSIRRRGGSYAASGQASRRPLKSLSDNLKSKQGIFRQNLLGKRVDYSGRSVIVIGPDLALDECGLPKHMALELFRPFVIARLLDNELAYNIRGANKLIDDGVPEVWALLEEVITGKYVLLNRAPTLHRLGIQAFRPRLIEGLAIQVHPLVCTAFNADFDGDQMAVHVPLSSEAQLEAKEIMASNKNLLKPGTGRPVVSAKMLDIVLGCYWMTRIIEGKKGEGMQFPSTNYAITAYDFGAVDFRAKVQVLPTDSPKYAQFEGKLFETSVGRLLFNSVLPKDFPYINKEIDAKLMQQIVDDLIEHYGVGAVPSILDKVKDFGFNYATHAGITWGLDNIVVPEQKQTIIEEAQKKVDEILEHYNDGLLSDEERYRSIIEIWTEAKSDIEKIIPENLDPTGSTYDMWKSGARGSLSQITTMSGMKGLIVNNQGRIIEEPVLTSSSEGHTPIEYFTTTHGSRKGLSDTALQTAKAGYLTRRLFDVAQDVVVTEDDCETNRSVTLTEENLSGIIIPLAKNAKGRFLAADVKNEAGETLFKKGHLLTQDDAEKIEEEGVKEIEVKSPMTCETLRGVCRKCYGVDLGTNLEVNLGEAVGTVAAQAIGEPGTQLTMRTFHQGGTASKTGDITSGLPRVEEIFEARMPKVPAVISHVKGTITDIRDEGKDKVLTILPAAGEKKKKATKSKKNPNEYVIPYGRTLWVEQGQDVERGEFLTDGSANLKEVFKYAGRTATQNYIISEVGKIYELQGASISRKHLEVMIKQMFSRVKVIEPGDTELAYNDVVEVDIFVEQNRIAEENGGEKAKEEPLLMGITQAALSRDSFLSSASFQHTTRILINSALKGSTDKLRGLKENVIIGRLIPAGTGFEGSPKQQMIKEANEEKEDNEY